MKDMDESAALIARMGAAARTASVTLATASAERKHAALIGAAEAIRQRADEVLSANAADLDLARKNGLGGAMLDRLRLDRYDAQDFTELVGAMRLDGLWFL